MSIRKRIMILAGLCVGMVAGDGLYAEVVELQQDDQAVRQRELLPLPQEVNIPRIARLQPGDVSIRGRTDASGLEKSSVSGAKDMFKEKTGVVPSGKGFEILIGVMDENGKLDGVEVPHGSMLKDVPNSDQAYVIQPIGENKLVVAGLSDRGVFYGVQTLRQLLEFHLSPESAEIPLASIVDWPDLEERGFWSMPSWNIPWLAALKMNRLYEDNIFTVDDTGIHLCRTYRNWPMPGGDYKKGREEAAKSNVSYEQARQYAVELVPGPTHMDFWPSRCAGYKKAFPGLMGKGESAKSGRRLVPCATNPDLVKVLTALITGLAAENPSEVMVWMSEYSGQCECDKCMKEGQFRAEVRSAIEAWQEAKKTYPDLKMSIFFGIGGDHYPYEQIRDIVASLPPEVTMRASLGCDGVDGNLLKDFAADGKRIARFNVASYRLLAPDIRFCSVDIFKRMQEIVVDGYIGAWQMIPGGFISENDGYRKTFSFRLSALAEYSWNVDGRDAKQFAEAWARRQGYKHPEKFLEWRELMMIPQADRELACWNGRDLTAAWIGRMPRMKLGKEWDASCFTKEDAEQGIRKSMKAVSLAEEMEAKGLAVDSRRLTAYCQLELAGCNLITAYQSGESGKTLEEAVQTWKESFNNYVDARKNVVAMGISLGNPDLLPKRDSEIEVLVNSLFPDESQFPEALE